MSHSTITVTSKPRGARRVRVDPQLEEPAPRRRSQRRCQPAYNDGTVTRTGLPLDSEDEPIVDQRPRHVKGQCAMVEGCQFGCEKSFTLGDQKELLASFWYRGSSKESRYAFINSMIDRRDDLARPGLTGNASRSCHRQYFLKKDGRRVRVSLKLCDLCPL